MTTTTYLIVPPADYDSPVKSSQCRIYAKANEHKSGLTDYRRDPDSWQEVGLVNGEGKLVCFDGPLRLFMEMQECEPLRPPLQFYARDGA